MSDREIRVTEGALVQAASEVAAAWKAAALGEAVAPTDRLYFTDWAALCAVLTPKRYELLRHLRATPAPSVRALARALERDVKRVHADVVAMEELGLLSRDPFTGEITTGIDEIALDDPHRPPDTGGMGCRQSSTQSFCGFSKWRPPATMRRKSSASAARAGWEPSGSRAPDLDALLRLAALRDVSDVKGLQRFELNSTGRALARRPALADQVRLALLAGSFWTIVNDRIERL